MGQGSGHTHYAWVFVDTLGSAPFPFPTLGPQLILNSESPGGSTQQRFLKSLVTYLRLTSSIVSFQNSFLSFLNFRHCFECLFTGNSFSPITVLFSRMLLVDSLCSLYPHCSPPQPAMVGVWKRWKANRDSNRCIFYFASLESLVKGPLGFQKEYQYEE